MKDINGIQTPFDTAICPVPTTGVGVTDVGGVAIPDGMKGNTGQMPEVSGVTLEDDKGPGLKRPAGMAGS